MLVNVSVCDRWKGIFAQGMKKQSINTKPKHETSKE
jgi:hypothetical protein